MAKSLSDGLSRSLPAELVRNILEELNREDLFNLRITCKIMNCYATPLAFGELHVWFEEQSLQNLINIASNPILRKNVRKIVVGMDYFYKFNFSDFKRYVFFEDNVARPTTLTQSDRAQRRDAWRVYQTYYHKQCAFEESGRDLAMMNQALKAFSSLVSVKLMDYQPWIDGFKGPRLLRTERLLQKHMLAVPNHSINIPRGGQQIRVLLQALAASGRKIEELSLHLESCNISGAGFYGPFPEAFHSSAVQALTGLKRLNLTLAPIRPNVLAVLEKDSHEFSLTTILLAATQVECLWVELTPPGDEPWNNYIHISLVSQFKELSLIGTLFQAAEFSLFLRSSCQKLQKLTIRDAREELDSWDLIFETIRSLPNLQMVELYSLWQYIGECGIDFLTNMNPQPLYDYLLRRRKDSPWHSMCQVEWNEYAEKNRDPNIPADEKADQESD